MANNYRGLVSQFRETLTQKQYSPAVVHNYCLYAGNFLSYLNERKISVEAVTPAIVSSFLDFAVRQFHKCHGHAPAPRWDSIPTSAINGVMRLVMKQWPPEPAASDVREIRFREVCDEYQTWLHEARGLATPSITALMWEARHFCAWYVKRAENATLLSLDIRDVDAYIQERSPKLRRKSLKEHGRAYTGLFAASSPSRAQCR